MESAPLLPPQKPAPELAPSKPKVRWNWFEMFKKRDQEPPLEKHKSVLGAAETKSTSEVRESSRPPERRRFAADIIMLLRKKEMTPSVPAEVINPSDKLEQRSSPERKVAPKQAELPVTPEVVSLPLVERAKEMGHSVLRLLGRTKQGVEAADRREWVSAPTDIDPLIEADADVRAAMRELIAPIEAYQAAHRDDEPGIKAADKKIEAEAAEKTDEAASDMGDGQGDTLSEAVLPIARPFEVAAAAHGVAALDILQAKERSERRSGLTHTIGLFALGATTLVGFAYTWRRMRKLKKQQRELQKQHKQFEAEVRESRASEERRLSTLETTDIQALTRPERQQYVHEVSAFAHTKAAEIRSVAQTTEVIRPAATAEHSVAARQQTNEMPLRSTSSTPEQPERKHTSVFDAPKISAEQGGLIERLQHVVGTAAHGAAQKGGNIAAAGSKLVHALGEPRSKQQTADQLEQTPRKQAIPPPAYNWLLNALLAVSIIVLIIMLALAIL